MKQTAIKQAIGMVKSRIESIDETLMGKHTIHHLQQIERGLYNLLEEEKEQMLNFYMWMRMNENAEKYLDNTDNQMINEYLNKISES